MKFLNYLLYLLCFSLMTGCSGSDSYRGVWNATNGSGDRFELNFDAKEFTVKDSAGQIKKYPYTQNSISIENSVETYGIKLEDGRNLQVHFPKADNDSLGVIRDDNGLPLFTISRHGYKSYDDLYKL